MNKVHKFVTIEYARAKLGRRGERMTDQQIDDLLALLRLLCNKIIDGIIECRSLQYEN